MNQRFELKKVKHLNGVLTSEWWETITTGDKQEFVNIDSRKSREYPHPEFSDALNALRPIVRDLLEVKQTPSGPEKVLITGVTLSGEGEKKAVIVTCKLRLKSGAHVPVNTPKMVLSQDKKLSKLIDKIDGEVNKFLFEGKRAQLEIVSDSNAA